MSKSKELYNDPDFNKNRTTCVESFSIGRSLYKRKITQGYHWTSLDKDLADQFFRDERWFAGIKFWDAIKIANHGAEEAAGKTKVGFNSQK